MQTSIGARRHWSGRAARSRSTSVGAAAALGAIALGVLLLLLITLPRARVVVYPPTTPLTGVVELRATSRIAGVDVAGRQIPVRSSYVQIEVAEQTIVRGRRANPNARAVGTVTLLNRVGEPIVVPEDTELLTPSGSRFRATASASLEATAGATVRAPVQAAQPGPDGNVARLEINRLLGPLAGRVAVLNEEPTSGGGVDDVPVVTAEDQTALLASVNDRILEEGLNRLRGDGRADEQLVRETVKLEPVDRQFDRAIGDESASLGIRAKSRVSAAFVSLSDVRRAAAAAWRPDLPSGYFLPEEQLAVGLPSVVRIDGADLIMRVPLESLAVASTDVERVKSIVRWQGPDDARREIVRTMTLAADPKIGVEPGWLGRAMRVDVAMDLNLPTHTPSPASTPTSAPADGRS